MFGRILVTFSLIAIFLLYGRPFATAESFHEIPRQEEKTLDAICAKTGEGHETSISGEHIYIDALRNWLENLPVFQQERVQKILNEAQPAMRGLRQAIRDKKSEMAELSFDRNTTPETLPRLGMELQKLRSALHHKLELLSSRLYFEAGVNLKIFCNDGFRLQPSSQHSKHVYIQSLGKLAIKPFRAARFTDRRVTHPVPDRCPLRTTNHSGHDAG